MIEYRRWNDGDNEAVAELEKKCFSEPWNLEMVISSFRLKNFIGFVAEDEGKVIGYVGSSYVFENADVLLIAVKCEYRLKGIATNLLQLTETELKKCGVKNLFLEVDENNYSAQKCYERFGFNRISLRSDYYGKGKNAIIMEKII